METRLSALSYEDVKDLTMHDDASDSQRCINSERAFNDVREKLMTGYGDVMVEIDRSQEWFDRVQIKDDKWIADNKNFTAMKQAWCDRYGCD